MANIKLTSVPETLNKFHILPNTISSDTVTGLDFQGNFSFNCNFLMGTEIKKIYSSCFEWCGSFTDVAFPKCEFVGDNGFFRCNHLSKIYLPQCSYIGKQGFCSCTSLEYACFPICSTIGSEAFNYCGNLKTIVLDSCISITGVGAFQDCTKLETINLPVCVSLPEETFESSGLITANLPLCSIVCASAFRNCINLTSVNLPACQIISSCAFRWCENLTSISLPACTSITGDAMYGGAFHGCSKLEKIYLMNSSVCYLQDSACFSGTKITSTTGSIFVPSSLVSTYQAASGWSYFSNRIFNGEEE